MRQWTLAIFLELKVYYSLLEDLVKGFQIIKVYKGALLLIVTLFLLQGHTFLYVCEIYTFKDLEYYLSRS